MREGGEEQQGRRVGLGGGDGVGTGRKDVVKNVICKV